MNNPLGVSPSKGKQGTTRGKEKIFWPRWVRFPPRSKDFFFASCGSLFPFTRANANANTSELILWFHRLCSQCYAAQHSYVPLLSIRRDSPSKIVPDFLCATL